MNNRKKYLLIIVITMLVSIGLGLVGCKKTSYAKNYDIYYANTDQTELVTLNYGTNQTDSSKILPDLLTQMNTTQKSNDTVVIKKDNVLIEKYYIENNIAYVYFSQEFYSMDITKQALFRAAIVKTLTQIDGVDYVMLFVNNLPLTYADGTAVGMMSKADFIEDNSVNNLQSADLTLYFANVKGDKLVKENVSVSYNKNISIERAVVEQLINGPVNSSNNRTLPVNLKVLKISVKDGICFVNLDSTFLTDIVNVSNSIPIYSIVNSLCDLEDVDKVQILINGESKKVFRESISLDAQFEANTDIISQDE